MATRQPSTTGSLRASASPRTSRPTLATGVIAAAGLAVIGLGAVGLANTDNLLASAYTTAMAAPDSLAAGRPQAVRSVAGSEDFWLSRRLPAGASPAAWVPPLATGDMISVAGGNGVERKLKVIGVRAAIVDAIVDSGAEGRMLLVECRDAASPANAAPVRLILDEAFAASLKAGAGSARAL